MRCKLRLSLGYSKSPVGGGVFQPPAPSSLASTAFQLARESKEPHCLCGVSPYPLVNSLLLSLSSYLVNHLLFVRLSIRLLLLSIRAICFYRTIYTCVYVSFCLNHYTCNFFKLQYYFCNPCGISNYFYTHTHTRSMEVKWRQMIKPSLSYHHFSFLLVHLYSFFIFLLYRVFSSSFPPWPFTIPPFICYSLCIAASFSVLFIPRLSLAVGLLVK